MTIGTEQTPKNWLWRPEGQPAEPGRAVIFDIDGVLANAEPRQHLITQPNCDWKAFFEACGGDEVIAETVQVLELIAPEVTRVLLTGRPLGVQETTVDWLLRKNLPWDLLIMRDRGEYNDSLTFKRQSVRRLRMMGYDVSLALEDDPLNRNMFQEEGVPCMYVHSGYYDFRDQVEKKAK